MLYPQSDFLRNVDQSRLVPCSSSRTASKDTLDLTASVPAIPTAPPPRPSGNSENSVQPQDAQARSENRIHWGPAIKESLLYTGIMHTFNIASEAGTRDTLNGKWFDDYIASVAELRGWSDSDHFMAPYVGHPIDPLTGRGMIEIANGFANNFADSVVFYLTSPGQGFFLDRTSERFNRAIAGDLEASVEK